MTEPEPNAVQPAAGGWERLELFARSEAGSLFTLFRRTLGDEEMARDLLQDTLIAAWRHQASYDRRRPFRNWIFRIGQNHLRNLLRRRRLERGAFEAMVDEPASRAPSPTGLLLEKERRERLERAILSLPHLRRIVLLLRYQEELSCADIGDILDMTPNAVSIQLHKARRSLRSMLGELGRTGDEVQ